MRESSLHLDRTTRALSQQLGLILDSSDLQVRNRSQQLPLPPPISNSAEPVGVCICTPCTLYKDVSPPPSLDTTWVSLNQRKEDSVHQKFHDRMTSQGSGFSICHFAFNLLTTYTFPLYAKTTTQYMLKRGFHLYLECPSSCQPFPVVIAGVSFAWFLKWWALWG